MKILKITLVIEIPELTIAHNVILELRNIDLCLAAFSQENSYSSSRFVSNSRKIALQRTKTYM